jgi:hypothetical protein
MTIVITDNKTKQITKTIENIVAIDFVKNNTHIYSLDYYTPEGNSSVSWSEKESISIFQH